jgi:alpha-ketoglutarate-dependent taurine dioxygenase
MLIISLSMTIQINANLIILAINQWSWQMNQLVFVSNKATPHIIHYTHLTHPSFIFKLKYPQKSGPCLKKKNKNKN